MSTDGVGAACNTFSKRSNDFLRVIADLGDPILPFDIETPVFFLTDKILINALTGCMDLNGKNAHKKSLIAFNNTEATR